MGLLSRAVPPWKAQPPHPMATTNRMTWSSLRATPQAVSAASWLCPHSARTKSQTARPRLISSSTSQHSTSQLHHMPLGRCTLKEAFTEQMVINRQCLLQTQPSLPNPTATAVCLQMTCIRICSRRKRRLKKQLLLLFLKPPQLHPHKPHHTRRQPSTKSPQLRLQTGSLQAHRVLLQVLVQMQHSPAACLQELT